MDLSRRLAQNAEAGPLLLGPLLSTVAAAAVLVVLGPAQPLPLLVLGMVGGAALFGLWRFDLVFSLFLFYLLFETVVGDFLPAPLAMVSKDLFYLAMLGLGFLALAARSQPASARPPAAATGAVLFLFVFYMLLALRGPTLELGALGFRSTAFLGGIAVLTPLAYCRARNRHASQRILIVGLSLVAIIAVWETVAWQQVRAVLELEQQRWSMGTLKAGSTVGGPGGLGALTGMGILFLIARSLEGELRTRAWVLIAVLGALWATALVMSFSRISQISMALMALLLLTRRPRLLLPGLLALGIGSMIADWATDGFFSGNLLATFGLGEHLDAIYSTEARVEIIHQVIGEHWPAKPWLGYGLGSVGAHTLTHSADSPMGYLFLDNMYLKALVEGGVVGFVVYLLSILVPLLASWKLDRALALRPRAPWRRALVRGAGASIFFYALIGTSSTVHEMPVINASIWWAIGLLFAEAARQSVERGEAQTLV